MRSIDMNSHDFRKQNLVTQKKGDFYKCSVCGCEGWRQSLSNELTVTEEMYKIASKCQFKPPQDERKSYRPKNVLLKTMAYVGIVGGVHPVIDCPEEYKNIFSADVWVWSDSRNEAVRILPHEIIDSE